MKKPTLGQAGSRNSGQAEDSTNRGPDGVMRRRPETAPKPPERRQHPLDIFVGKRIVLQRGPAIYAGRLEAITARWLILTDAKIIGTSRNIEVK